MSFKEFYLSAAFPDDQQEFMKKCIESALEESGIELSDAVIVFFLSYRIRIILWLY